MSDWVTGLFTIGGVAAGTVFEPAKNMFTSRARTRQARAERCASFIEAAEACSYYAVEFNAVHRATVAGSRIPAKAQTDSWVEEANKARADVRRMKALLRMFGPDLLAEQAGKVFDATQVLSSFINENDAGPHVTTRLPVKVQEGQDALSAEIDMFARIARKYTR
jgi:hypothetical protein